MDFNTPDLGPQQAVKCGERKVPATTAARAGMGVGGRWYSRSTCPAASNACRCTRRGLTPNTCRPLASPCRLHVSAQCTQPCHAMRAVPLRPRTGPHTHTQSADVWTGLRHAEMECHGPQESPPLYCVPVFPQFPFLSACTCDTPSTAPWLRCRT